MSRFEGNVKPSAGAAALGEILPGWQDGVTNQDVFESVLAVLSVTFFSEPELKRRHPQN